MPTPNGDAPVPGVVAVERIAPALTRAGVTLILAAVFSIGFLKGLVDGGNFTTVVGMVMAFWFGSRGDERRATDGGAQSQTASATTAGAAPATATVTTTP